MERDVAISDQEWLEPDLNEKTQQKFVTKS